MLTAGGGYVIVDVAFNGPASKLLKDAFADKQLTTEVSTTTLQDRTAPVIGSFEWWPTRVLNGRVYDAVISFTVSDSESVISDVGAVLSECPTYLPARSYPEEPQRTLQLARSPIGTSMRTVQCSGQLNDLKGGKRYRASVVARDSAGNMTDSRFDTPYVREFENVSGTDKILIGAFYYPWYGPGDVHWSEGYRDTPILDRYYSGDSSIISKHIDWATGHGIDFLVASWWGPSESKEQPDFNLKAILRNDLTGDIALAILYESLGRLRVTYQAVQGREEPRIDFDNPENVDILVRDFEYLAENYLGHSAYLTIDGAPLVYLYLTRVYVGDVNGALKLLKERMKELGFDLFLVGDQVYWQDPGVSSESARIRLYDAVSSYNMYTAIPSWLRNFEARLDSKYRQWFSQSRRLGVGFIPDVIPGYDDTAVVGSEKNPILEKSVTRFRRQIDIARKYLDDELRMVLITSFNEWHEGTNVEPSIEEGFQYLESLRASLATD